MAVDKEHQTYTLFGGEKCVRLVKTPWKADDWVASDDRVRGGKSQSYLNCSKDEAHFHGTLDIKTLGGAGFASQHTTRDNRVWDLSDYAGIQLNLKKGDKKRYTFILKDEILPKNKEIGREQASISYECDFELPPQAEPGDSHDRSVFIPWAALNPTYRGKLKKDAKPLKKDKIKRMSIMMRSFFGTQEGDFSLLLGSIVALKEIPTGSTIMKPTTDMWQVEAAESNDRTDAALVGFKIDSRYFKLDIRIHRNIAIALAAALSLTSLYSTVLFVGNQITP